MNRKMILLFRIINFRICSRTLILIFYLVKSSIGMSHEYTHEKITIRGFDIKLSEALANNCLFHPTQIEIFAWNKIIIDDDYDSHGHLKLVSVIAPIIEVVKKSVIDLSGQSAESHPSSKASPSIGHGRDGKPGNPGGSSGSIMIIAKAFLNEKQCDIHLNGGDGGIGQDGGDGTEHFVYVYSHFVSFQNL